MRKLPPAPWGKPWFRPKSFGYGAGLPCSWEGWGVLVGFISAISGWVALAPPPDDAQGLALLLGGAAAIIVALIWIARGRTSGGWRRR